MKDFRSQEGFMDGHLVYIEFKIFTFKISTEIRINCFICNKVFNLIVMKKLNNESIRSSWRWRDNRALEKLPRDFSESPTLLCCGAILDPFWGMGGAEEFHVDPTVGPHSTTVDVVIFFEVAAFTASSLQLSLSFSPLMM